MPAWPAPARFLQAREHALCGMFDDNLESLGMLRCWPVWPEALEIIWARHHARRWGPCGPGPVIAGEGSSTDRAPTSGGPLRAQVAPVALALGLPLSSVRQDIQRHWFLQTFIDLGRSVARAARRPWP